MNRKVFLTLGLMLTLVLSGCNPSSVIPSTSTGGSETPSETTSTGGSETPSESTSPSESTGTSDSGQSESVPPEPEPVTYSISVNEVSGATVTAPSSSEAGETITVSVAVTDSSKYCDGILLSSGDDVATVTVGSEYSFTMPAADVAIRAILETRTSYGVMATVKGAIDGFAIAPAKDRYYEGDTVTVNVTNISTTYEYHSITTKGLESPLTEVEAGKTYTFTMPANDVYLTLNVSAIPTYALTISAGEGGIVFPDKSSYYAGEEMNVTISPDEQYSVDTVTFNGEAVDPAAYASGTLTLVAQESNVLDVTFKRTTVTILDVAIVNDYNEVITSVSGVDAGQEFTIGSSLTLNVSVGAYYSSLVHVQIGNQIKDLVATETSGEYTVTFDSIDVTDDFKVFVYYNPSNYVNPTTTIEDANGYFYIKYTNTEIDMVGYAGEDVPYMLKPGGYSASIGFLTPLAAGNKVTSVLYRTQLAGSTEWSDWSGNMATSSLYSSGEVLYTYLPAAFTSGSTIEIDIAIEYVGLSELTILGSHVTNRDEINGTTFRTGDSSGYIYIDIEAGYYANTVEIYNTDTHELITDLNVNPRWSSSNQRIDIYYTAPAYNITVFVHAQENPTITINADEGVESVVIRSGTRDTSSEVDLASAPVDSTLYAWITPKAGYLVTADSVTMSGATYSRNTSSYYAYSGSFRTGYGDVTMNVTTTRGVIVTAGTSENGTLTFTENRTQVSSTTVASASTVSFTATPATGYYFDGLYSDEALTTQIAAPSAYSFTVGSEDITVYAKFSAYHTTSFTVTLNGFTDEIKAGMTSITFTGRSSGATIDALSDTLTSDAFYYNESISVSVYPTSSDTHYFNITYTDASGTAKLIGPTNGAYGYFSSFTLDQENMTVTFNAEEKLTRSATFTGLPEGSTWYYCDYSGTEIEGATGVIDGETLYIKLSDPGDGYKWVINSATLADGTAAHPSFNATTNIITLYSVYNDVTFDVSRVEIQQTTLLVTNSITNAYSATVSFSGGSGSLTDGAKFESSSVSATVYFWDSSYAYILYDMYVRTIDAEGNIETIKTYTNQRSLYYESIATADQIAGKTLWIVIVPTGEEAPTEPPVQPEADFSVIAGTYTWLTNTLVINADGTATYNEASCSIAYDGTNINFTSGDYTFALTQDADGNLTGTYEYDYADYDCTWTKSA